MAATRAQDYLILAGQICLPRPEEDRDPKERASWLQLWLEALRYEPGEPAESEDTVEELDRQWGKVRVQRLSVWPARPGTPAREDLQHAEQSNTTEFPMAGPVPSAGAMLLPEPTATDLARIMQYLSTSPASEPAETLAAATERAAARARTIYPAAPRGDRSRVPGRILGQLAHKALEQWRLPKRTPDLDRILENQAWNLGLTDESPIERAASQTMDLLRRFERSDLYREMTAAGTTRRHEVPFSVPVGGRLVHGTIDALFRRPGGRWVVVDFKTEQVEGDREALQENIDANHITQVAIYALAITELVGHTPVVLLHYVRPGQTVPVPEADWQRQLKLLGVATMVT
ncbi:MAG TPA: PD-(D/E)XK nuclease family protein [Chloroflexota bacterium]|nr:PD-(D/E)XK nuclease family protein [Chloroflexota bacterium]